MPIARVRWDRRCCRQLEYVRKDIRQVHVQGLTLTCVNPNLCILTLPRGKVSVRSSQNHSLFVHQIKRNSVKKKFVQNAGFKTLSSLCSSMENMPDRVKTSRISSKETQQRWLSGHLEGGLPYYHPISRCRSGKKRSGRTGFVNISACWSSVRTY